MPDPEQLREFPKWDYQEYPKTLARDDFWGQGRRTIMGRRITEEEVTLLVEHIGALLDIQSHDVLLDLGCGNGALTARLFDRCSGYAGVDRSAYLIDVAREFFERKPDFVFFEADVLDFAHTVERPWRFTKGLSYAVMQYLSRDTVSELLTVLRDRLVGLELLVLGNVPDRERAEAFFKDRFDEQDLDQHESQIGRWWSSAELQEFAAGLGWSVEIERMAEDFFNARYRFDAILRRR